MTGPADVSQSPASPEDRAGTVDTPRRIAIVGGGLAGLAAAVALADSNVAQKFSLSIELFESRRQLGGRAASFRDPGSGELVDHCQHVSLGCCTNLADFCHRVGLTDLFRRDRTLTFMSPEGRQFSLAGSRWLPAPLHLLPSLLRLGYLSWFERVRIVTALRQLAAEPQSDELANRVGKLDSIEAWLRAHGQSSRAIELFWQPVIVSALSEEPGQTSVAAARKVFVDGLMRSRQAYEMLVPRVPLSELYGPRLIEYLQTRGVGIRLWKAVRRVAALPDGAFHVDADSEFSAAFDAVIVALPWRAVAKTFDDSLLARLPKVKRVVQFESAPITGVHLWFDRPFTDLPHAVLPGRLSQWLFNRGAVAGDGNATGGRVIEHYYQIVISASQLLSQQSHGDVVAQVHRDLLETWPAAYEAKLLRWRVVTEQHAVFSPRPGSDALRPSQKTAVPGLFLAGDWTATGWPATMEGAVRSGYLAAEALLDHFGLSAPGESIVVPDLPVARLSRWFLGIH